MYDEIEEAVDQTVEEHRNPYKINIGDTILIERSDVDWKGHTLTFYKTPINTMINGKEETFYKQIYFKKDVDLLNGTKIVIKNMFEAMRHKDKYNDTFGLRIVDFDIADQTTPQAVQEYRQQIMNNKQMQKMEDNDIIF